MLKSKKKEVKKPQPKPKPKPKVTQKQKQMTRGAKPLRHLFVQGQGPSHEQTQNTKVIVNIGKTTKSKSRAPRKTPIPTRPQVIPIYTPTYQSQPQQQYNNDDLRTLFRARTQANENPLKELTREIKLPQPNRPPVRLEEGKQGYTDPKLDYEVLLDYKDPPLDTRKPDRIMADAQFRAEVNAEYQAFDAQFLKPEQTPTLAEAVEETTREELSTGAELAPVIIKKEEEPEPVALPSTYKQGAEQRMTSQEILKLYGLKNQKEVRAKVDAFNADNPDTPIKTTRDDTRANKNIEELIKELEQRQAIRQLDPELEGVAKVKKSKGGGKK
jgi:hypothetical protein